eukprot:2645752-Rhodomonas_salina.1
MLDGERYLLRYLRKYTEQGGCDYRYSDVTSASGTQNRNFVTFVGNLNVLRMAWKPVFCTIRTELGALQYYYY